MAKDTKREQYIYPIDLTEFSILLRRDAVEQERSIHFLVKKIVRQHYEQRGLVNKKKAA